MASSDAIRAFLLALQEELGGFISFERFMQEALYHPEFGYYSKNIKSVGARGDFSTTATLSNELGTVIWNWSGAGKNRELSEIGAGDGSLARAIFKAAGWRRFFLNYRIHEVSVPLRAAQRKRLGWRVKWINQLSEIRGVAFANELVDAFPCRVFEKTPEGWREVFVRLEGSLLFESLRSGELPASSVFDAADWPIGQRVEVTETFRSWINDAARALASTNGQLLLIDYGGEPEEIYHRRLQGSVRAYWKHQRFTGDSIYARFGHQDLTADVNFQDICTWAEEAGFHRDFYGSQTDFMTLHGLRPSGAEGDHFKVLALTLTETPMGKISESPGRGD